MKLIAYPTGGPRLEVRPAPATRDWMDALPAQYGYRCLPLNIANAHGWEILAPAAVEVRWDGNAGREAIRVIVEEDIEWAPASHFGSGILTFHTGYLVETEPGMNLWVSGPPNNPKAGITPLTGIVETDWSPYSFTMNWKFTQAHMTVRFEAGEPIAFFFPVPRGIVEACTPEFRSLEEIPEKAEDYRTWSSSRAGFLKDLPEPGTEANEQRWQKWYFRGLKPDGSPGIGDHQTKVRAPNFKERTGGRALKLVRRSKSSSKDEPAD